MVRANVRPAGWLRQYLDTQMHGLTGHIEKAGFPFDRQFWGLDQIPEFKSTSWWWPFEQTGYHIDGYVRTAILLRNGAQLAKAKRMVYSVIDHPDADGYLGPDKLKEIQDGFTRWPHTVFFRACLAMYEYNHDLKIIEALTNHYLGYPVDHSGERNVLNVEIMLAVYSINRNQALLDMAINTYEAWVASDPLKVTKDVAEKAWIHGVTYNEQAKLGALLYRYTGKEQYLQYSLRAYEKVDMHYMLPGGCLSSSEYLLNDRYDEAYETCDIADMSWSLHYLSEICDDISYADKIEKCVFNSGVGSVLEDFKALQYFSCANQLITSKNSSHATLEKGGGAMRYAPKPLTECCSGNVNRIMPNYGLSMWSSDDNTVTARMYGPSIYSGKIGNKKFCIEEETDYPFDLSARFTVRTGAPFKLRLRIPGWCKHFTMKGAQYRVENGFAVVQIQADAQLSVSFDAEICQMENHGGVYYTRGPLVYSLGMKGDRYLEGDAKFPQYKIVPDKPWNWAIVGDGAPVFTPGTDVVWDLDAKLPNIQVDARQVENWRIVTQHEIQSFHWDYVPYTRTGEFALTPSLPDMESSTLSPATTRITLYPYGACKVRMTVLPKV